MTSQRRADERAVSPVVGTALLIGITVILATVVGTVVLGVDVGSAATPEVTLSFKVVDGGSTVELYHEGGDPLAKDEIVVRDEDGTAYELATDRLNTGERTEIEGLDPAIVERITVVWQAPHSSSESVLATFRP